MAPKKKVEEEPPPDEEPEEPAEPETFVKCFRTAGGQIYAGECEANNAVKGTFIRQGQGKQIYTAKNVAGEDCIVGTYEGEWEKDLFEGAGIYRWPDGSSYEGCFRGGQIDTGGEHKESKGIFIWPDGSSYEGHWSQGQMCGKGRFDSKRDGSFMVGAFHRNYFLENAVVDGQRTQKWVDICGLQAQGERDDLVNGDTSTIPVYGCTSAESLVDILGEVQSEGLVPFLIADASLPGDAVMDFTGQLLQPSSTLRLSEAAFKRRQTGLKRDQDATQFFYEALQNALVHDRLLSVLFDDAADPEPYATLEDCTLIAPPSPGANRPVSQSRPSDDWRLENYFCESAFPREVFNLTFFNSRMGFWPYLPKNLAADFREGLLNLPRDQKMIEPAVAAGEEPPASDGAAGNMPAPGKVPPRVHHLRFIMAALAKLPSDLSPEEIRMLVVGRYGQHAPLHRTAVVLLTAQRNGAADLTGVLQE